MVVHEAALAQITPRRFELLLACVDLPVEFTASELRAHMQTPASSVAAVTRDLRGLEAGGWLLARPPRTQKRQGQTVVYSLNRALAGRAFHDWGRLMDDALTSTPSPSAP